MRSRISRLNGAVIINDAYNANPASMAASFAYLKEFADPQKLVLLLGGMLELGENSGEMHEKILSSALELFPGAKIMAAGLPFVRAAEKYAVPFFEKPAEAAGTVSSLLVPGNIIFVKGSRGIGMENALPQEAR
ncbi:MAG: hypothetical protein IKC65_05445 [Lentisphaeria bacterium]|nr:hypothetical protein [Lentisphaeria bacterium]